VRDFFRATFRTKTKAEWIEWFKGRDIAFAPVKTLPEMLEDPHFRARGMVLGDSRGWDHIGIPIKFAAEPGRINFRAPAHGEHSIQILREIGYTDDEIESLGRARVIKDAAR
jgi:crotonobetainyl-CoA:carnitine CoA-transferase CaiB-like acyl-CoA transferase